METTISVSSVMGAPADKVWRLLGQIETLQTIAKPYAYFKALDDVYEWKPGGEYRFWFRLLGVIPVGVHNIRVVRWDKDSLMVQTHESDRLAKVWNHTINLEPLTDGSTKYTDTVVIGAGRLTAIVRLWSIMFYRHRQRKWKRLLKRDSV